MSPIVRSILQKTPQGSGENSGYVDMWECGGGLYCYMVGLRKDTECFILKTNGQSKLNP